MPGLPSLPPIRVLGVFEAAARHGNFTAAAGELATTQSAVSRAVADLERRLGTRLFERGQRGVRLTQDGRVYLEAVSAGLGRIAAAGAALAAGRHGPVVIAAGDDVATLFLMPLREDLYRRLGAGGTHAHILTCDHGLLDRIGAHEADLVLSWDPGGGAPGDRAVAFGQEVRPVCAPAYAREHARALARPVREWAGLTLLESARPGLGQATWDDWFEAAGRPAAPPPRLTYFDPLFLLEDAVAGKGLAIGCRRLLERHLASGKLVAAGDGFLDIGRPHWARLTERGRRRPEARRLLRFLGGLAGRGGEA